MREPGGAVTDSLKAVLLDVGGTMIESRPSPAEVYARVLSRHGRAVRGEDVEPAFRAVWAELTQKHPPGLDRYHSLKGGEWEWWGEFLRRVLGLIQHEAPWEPVLTELFDAFAEPSLWHVFPEVHEVLEALQRRGLRLAVVSNWDTRLPDLLVGLDLARHFDAILVSGIEGIEKPSAEIFRRAATRLGVEPKSCLHVGDSPLDDVRGAESAGMRAALVDRFDLFRDGYIRMPDLRGIHALLT
jgi:putative hydrolase of the HAD superfamily